MRPVFLACLLLPLVSHSASAEAYVAGTGVAEGRIGTNHPEPTEALQIQVQSEGAESWPFMYIARWDNANETWPHAFHSALNDASRRLQADAPNISIRVVAWEMPVYLFVVGNYTTAKPTPLDQHPTTFFMLDRSEVAFAYDPKWPLATIWCKPDCPNLRGDISMVLFDAARIDTRIRVALAQANGQLFEVQRDLYVSMDPRNATQLLDKLSGVRLSVEEGYSDFVDRPELYDRMQRYPSSLRAPIEDYRNRALSRITPDHNASMRWLASLEARIGNAMQVHAFEAQSRQTSEALYDARQASNAALAEARVSTLVAAAALGAFVMVAIGTWLFPSRPEFVSWWRRQRFVVWPKRRTARAKGGHKNGK
jgi:hypothetical protein